MASSDLIHGKESITSGNCNVGVVCFSSTGKIIGDVFSVTEAPFLFPPFLPSLVLHNVIPYASCLLPAHKVSTDILDHIVSAQLHDTVVFHVQHEKS